MSIQKLLNAVWSTDLRQLRLNEPLQPKHKVISVYALDCPKLFQCTVRGGLAQCLEVVRDVNEIEYVPLLSMSRWLTSGHEWLLKS